MEPLKSEFTSVSPTTKGLKLYSETWTPASPPVAVLVFIHGLGEHVGRYADGAAQRSAALAFVVFLSSHDLCFVLCDAQPSATWPARAWRCTPSTRWRTGSRRRTRREARRAR